MSMGCDFAGESPKSFKYWCISMLNSRGWPSSSMVKCSTKSSSAKVGEDGSELDEDGMFCVSEISVLLPLRECFWGAYSHCAVRDAAISALCSNSGASMRGRIG